MAGLAGTNIQIHNPVMVGISVADALGRLSLTQERVNDILSKRELWAIFGKMNSHLYRKILMDRMQEAGLNGEQQFMIFFLYGVIKNRDRILKAMEMMEPADQAQAWFNPVRSFIQTHMTQYVSDVVRSKKFPGVNVPNCNPGLDILVYLLITNPNDRSYLEMCTRPTFSQLLLESSVQEDAKDGYRTYWDDIVTGTKNPDKTPQNLEEPKFREEYYENVRRDDYKLINLNLEEVPPANLAVGYTLVEIYEYIVSIDVKGEYDRDNSRLWREMVQDLSDLGYAEAQAVMNVQPAGGVQL